MTMSRMGMLAALACMLHSASAGAEDALLMGMCRHARVPAVASVLSCFTLVSSYTFMQRRIAAPLEPVRAVQYAALPVSAGQRYIRPFKGGVPAKSQSYTCKNCGIAYYPPNEQNLCNRCMEKRVKKESQNDDSGIRSVGVGKNKLA